MFNFSELKQVNLEITNRCQAACPMCPRNIHGGIENPLLKINDWTIDDFTTIFTPELTRQIQVFDFCGNFGDPLMNNDLIKMCKYIKTENPSALTIIHTNGSLRSSEWWSQLIHSLTLSHNIVFALDGLDDTHSLYRINTSFTTIIKNATTFINTGGTATWHYIRFHHNAHQVNDAQSLATTLGFKEFTIKDSRRFTNPKFKVVNPDGSESHVLEPALKTIPIVNKLVLLDTYDVWANSNRISCFALDERDVFIDAHFTVMPCCILSSFLYTNYDEEILKQYNLHDADTSVNQIGETIKQQVLDTIATLGGFDALNARTNGVKNIIDNAVWQTIWQEQWRTHKSLTCMLMCSKDSPFLSLQKQITSTTQVN